VCLTFVIISAEEIGGDIQVMVFDYLLTHQSISVYETGFEKKYTFFIHKI